MYAISKLLLKSSEDVSLEVLRQLDGLLKSKGLFLIISKDHTNFYEEVIWYNTVLGSAPVQYECHYGQTHAFSNFFELTEETEGFFPGKYGEAFNEILDNEYYINIGCAESCAQFPWVLLGEPMQKIKDQHDPLLHGIWCQEGVEELKEIYQFVVDELEIIELDRLDRIARFQAAA